MPEPISETPKGATRAIIVILVAMSFLAVYANVQKLRRAKIEEVQVTPNPASALAPGAH